MNLGSNPCILSDPAGQRGRRWYHLGRITCFGAAAESQRPGAEQDTSYHSHHRLPVRLCQILSSRAESVGFRLACKEACRFMAEQLSTKVDKLGRDCLVNVAKTSMSSKILAVYVTQHDLAALNKD